MIVYAVQAMGSVCICAMLGDSLLEDVLALKASQKWLLFPVPGEPPCPLWPSARRVTQSTLKGALLFIVIESLMVLIVIFLHSQ